MNIEMLKVIPSTVAATCWVLLLIKALIESKKELAFAWFMALIGQISTLILWLRCG